MKSAPQPCLSTPSSRAKPVHLLSFFPSFDATRPNLFSTDPGAYFAAPLFSYSYELVFQQALYFDNDPHCPAGRVVTPSSVAPGSPCLCRNSPLFKHLQTLCFSLRSFPHSDRLFSITSALFLQNTRGGGAPALPRHASLPPSYAPRSAFIPYSLSQLRILPVTTGVWCPPLRCTRTSILQSLNSVPGVLWSTAHATRMRIAMRSTRDARNC